jgi:hypothetical protein
MPVILNILSNLVGDHSRSLSRSSEPMTFAGAHWFFLGFNPADGLIFAVEEFSILIRMV